MKNQIFRRLVAMIPVLIAISSGSPTSSQKTASEARRDTAPLAKPVQEDSVRAFPTDSLLKETFEKAEKASEIMDRVGRRGDRINSKLSVLENRQARILLHLTPVEVIWTPQPVPGKELQISHDTPEIKPVEVSRPSWWRRTFGHD